MGISLRLGAFSNKAVGKGSRRFLTKKRRTPGEEGPQGEDVSREDILSRNYDPRQMGGAPQRLASDDKFPA